MPATAHRACRVDYKGSEIVIRGPSEDARREAYRIVRRFACSGKPYRVASDSETQVVLKPI